MRRSHRTYRRLQQPGTGKNQPRLLLVTVERQRRRPWDAHIRISGEREQRIGAANAFI